MLVTVHIQPNAKKNEVVSWLDDSTMKVRVTAPAKEGRANKALIKILSDYFKTSKTSIELVRGATTKIKQLRIPSEAVGKIKKPK